MRVALCALSLAALHLPAAAAEPDQVQDARAAVRQGWIENYAGALQGIETAYRCKVLDQTTANAAMIKLQGLMQGDLNRAGLIGDRVLTVQGFADPFIEAGIRESQGNRCAALTPEWRGRVRMLAARLLRM